LMRRGGDCFVAHASRARPTCAYLMSISGKPEIDVPRNDNALSVAPRPAIVQRHPGLVVELADELVEQPEELGALGRREGGEHARLGALRWRREALEHALAGAGQREAGAAAVARADRAADQPGLLELPDHHAGGGAVEAEQARDR